jgi:ADP-heptose:LPS heptosyltransferase
MKKLRTGALSRLADRYLGSFLIYGASLLKSKRTFKGSVNRAAFLKTAAIGDTILISAVVSGFRQTYPNAELVFVCGEGNSLAASMFADQIVTIDHRKPAKAIKKVRSLGHFDAVLDFGSWPSFDALVASSFNSDFTVGFKTQGRHRHYLYDKVIEHSQEVHELENYKRLAKLINIESDSMSSIKLDVEKQDKRVVFHMFSGGSKWYLKEWAAEKWLILADILCSKGYEVCVTGAKDDYERAVLFCRDTGGRAVNCAGKSFAETAELLKSSSLVVSVNTGVMHLACAVGCNVIDLCGPVRPERWGGVSENCVSLASSAPYISLGFEEKEGNPMNEICVESVLTEAKRFIDI